ncbi:MAG: hypothetical protein OXU45_02590 [Candidatus Melainabacteria bacterium]|nr:hypothetical protein [Candidatus Melainabacteria bacterium]
MIENIVQELINEMHKFPSLYALLGTGLVVLAGAHTMMWFDDHQTSSEEEA